MNLMVDIETLGKKPGCAILSIAVVPFMTDSDIEPFYERIHPTSCAVAGLTVDEDTWKWWHNQDAAVREEAFSGTTPLSTVLFLLSEYVGQFEEAYMWGNGASFDIPILEAAYDGLKVSYPWKYYNARCYRTLKNLFPEVTAPVQLDKHNALADARFQAAHAEKILKWLSSK